MKRAYALASAAFTSSYFCVRFSFEKTCRINLVLNMLQKAESMTVEGIVFPQDQANVK
jgi:hypothetical protein